MDIEFYLPARWPSDYNGLGIPRRPRRRSLVVLALATGR